TKMSPRCAAATATTSSTKSSSARPWVRPPAASTRGCARSTPPNKKERAVRLPRVDHGHALPQRLLLGFIALINKGQPPYDVVRMLLFKPKWFGKAFSALSQAVMRGPSEWQVWERELMAAFVSKLNQCPF